MLECWTRGSATGQNNRTTRGAGGCELWGANQRPVNQPPIIIDTGSTSRARLPSSPRAHEISGGFTIPFYLYIPTRECFAHTIYTAHTVTNAPPIPSFISQMCCKTAAIHFPIAHTRFSSIQFSAPAAIKGTIWALYICITRLVNG